MTYDVLSRYLITTFEEEEDDEVESRVEWRRGSDSLSKRDTIIAQRKTRRRWGVSLMYTGPVIIIARYYF